MSDAETELVAELRALVGVGASTDFVVARGPHRIEVHYRSGSSSSVRLGARYDDVARADHETIVVDAGGTGSYRRPGHPPSLVAIRPLSIVLRRERANDVEAKRKGINVEHQTGDDEFDRNVYVSTPTTDARLLDAVLGPRVRRGVLALFALGFCRVEIDEEGAVAAHLWEFAQLEARPGRGARAVDAFALVLSDLPAITASGGAHVAPPIWSRTAPLVIAMIVAGVGLIPASCTVADASHCLESTTTHGDTSVSYREGCGKPALLAFVVALLVAVGAAFSARALATPRLRGRSDSSKRILLVRFAAFSLTLVATYVLASHLAFVHLAPHADFTWEVIRP